MAFCTILHSLNSPQNVGMIVRTHVANGGNEIIITGHDLPWRFKKGSQAFSRKLEKMATIIHIPNPEDVFAWCDNNDYKIISLEIQEKPTFLNNYKFPSQCAIAVGNEASGLPGSFLKKCFAVVTIPQHGEVGSLNVAVSASIAMYELNRNSIKSACIKGSKYKENTSM